MSDTGSFDIESEFDKILDDVKNTVIANTLIHVDVILRKNGITNFDSIIETWAGTSELKEIVKKLKENA